MLEKERTEGMCDRELLKSSVCPAVLTGAQRSRRQEPETDTQQGSASSFFLARLLHTTLSPALPGGTCFPPVCLFQSSSLFPSFLSLQHQLLSFLSSFFLSSVTLPFTPSFSVFLIDKLTMALPLSLASGISHTSMPGILCTVLHAFT